VGLAETGAKIDELQTKKFCKSRLDVASFFDSLKVAFFKFAEK